MDVLFVGGVCYFQQVNGIGVFIDDYCVVEVCVDVVVVCFIVGWCVDVLQMFGYCELMECQQEWEIFLGGSMQMDCGFYQ